MTEEPLVIEHREALVYLLAEGHCPPQDATSSSVKASLPISLYSVRNERQFCERLR